MMAATTTDFETSLEVRYVALVQLASSLAAASDWSHVASAVSSGLGPLDSGVPVRVWGHTADGFEELARWPASHAFGPVSPRALREAAESQDAGFADGDSTLLVGVHAGGVSLGVLEVASPDCDPQFLTDAAPIVASRAGLLAAEGVGPLLSPLSVESASDTSAVMAAFAAEAKRLLQHDRLSAYLLTDDGRAFERFAVATSPIIPGEGVVIPFHEVGLRHIVATNRALVSDDLGTDPRIVGREDRVIAGAGFHGLLSVPLRLGGRPIGVLNFVSRTPAFYRDADVPVAEQIADQVSVFIENLRRQRRVRTVVRQEAIERERERLTREIYHAVTQTAREIDRLASEARHRFMGGDPWLLEQLRTISDIATTELTEVRRAVLDASPRALAEHTLGDVIESTLARLGGDGGLETRLKVTGDVARLPLGTARAVYSVFQEALLNVRVHAMAASVDVELGANEDLVLTVRDDGLGFDPAVAAGGPGLGLHGIRERARALGGTVLLESAPDGGTSLTLTIPGAFDRHAAGPGQAGSRDAEAETAGAVRVFVADAEPLSRAGLSAILNGAGGIRTVGEAESLADALPEVERLRPDVVLVDTSATGGDAASAIGALRAGSPSSAILVLARSRHLWPKYLIDAGVDGCITEESAFEELPRTVTALADGATVFIQRNETDDVPLGSTLTPREREVLELVAAGHTNGEIGKALFLATKTVERQVATIATKLGARNRAHAAALAVARRLVGL